MVNGLCPRRHGAVWGRGREFFRRDAILDRSSKARVRHALVGAHLFAQSLHFFVSKWNGCAIAHGDRSPLRIRRVRSASPCRLCPSRLDLLSIERLCCLYGSAPPHTLGVGIYFGLRLINAMSQFLSGTTRNQLRLWGFIFVVVSLQMTSTLRPLIVPGKTFFPTEKKFFLANWFESLSGSSEKKE